MSDTPNSTSTLDSLRASHVRELHWLLNTKRGKNAIKKRSSYLWFVVLTINEYVYFLAYTWAHALWELNMAATVLFDRVTIIAAAAVVSVVMFFVLLWCLFCKIPVVGKLFSLSMQSVLPGVSPANSILPDLFDILDKGELSCAYNALSEPMSASPNTRTYHEFNLDIAKLLLQCSALMYERPSPVDPQGPRQCNIEDFAAKCGLKFVILSELGSISRAGCGAFWHPDEKFIIVAFKGTSPDAFGEWATDMTYAPRRAGGWIRGFDRVHGGFFSKIFPSNLELGHQMPYITIQQKVNLIAEDLRKGKPTGTVINVWMTGHSLGCSLASLMYAGQINELPNPSDHPIVMRDAYIFAAPIVCDVTSVNAFNNEMRRPAHPRTLWRLTNGKDIVATGLPHMGDYSQWDVSSTSVYSYAHLGAEIKMSSDVCTVDGTLIPHGSEVWIKTDYKRPHQLPVVKPEARRREDERKLLKFAEKLPILGQFLAHAPVSYWVALSEVKGGRLCKWRR